jgi:hypothetical protein
MSWFPPNARRVAAMSDVRLPFTQLSYLVLLPTLLLCLPGCFFGVGTVFTETTVVDAPLISQKKGHIWVKTEMPRQRTIMASELLEYWGEPDEIVKINGDEAWIYQFGLRWNGLMVAVIIPIPLAVPVGHDELSFSIDEDKQVNSVTIKGMEDNGFFCTFLFHTGCYVSSEWMCKFLPLCGHFPREPFPKQFREYRKDNLIPGQT